LQIIEMKQMPITKYQHIKLPSLQMV